MLDELKFKFLQQPAGNIVAEPAMKDRLIDAGRAVAIGTIGETLIRLAMKKSIPLNKQIALKQLLAGKKKVVTEGVRLFSPGSFFFNAAFNTIGGLYGRDIKNAIAKANVDKTKKQDALAKFKEVNKYRAGMPTFEKEAFFREIGRGIGWGFGATAKAGRTFAGGVMMGAPFKGDRVARRLLQIPGKDKYTMSQHVFGTGSKLIAGYGAYKGISSGYKAIKRFKTPYATNYTSMLRNNMLAGKIRPGELSYDDTASVQRLGTR